MDLVTIVYLVAALLVSPSLAANYVVGGNQGWDSGVDYTTWTTGKTFTVGDTLSFQYTSLHSVLEVSKTDYDSCQTSNALTTHTGGSTTLKLSTAGNKYYICGTPGHCSSGMKLAIGVKAATSATPSTPSGGATSPSPPSSITPPSSTTTPSSKSPSGNKSAATSYEVKSFLVLSGAAAVSVLLM